MNEIDLSYLKIKTFTEQNVLDYCQINSINYNNIINLNLNSNKLTDISGIKLFKNLIQLNLESNKRLTDISVLKYLKELSYLYISDTEIKDISYIENLEYLQELWIKNLRLKSDQIQYIKSFKKIKELLCYKGFKDMFVIKQLNKNIRIEKNKVSN